MLRPRPRLHFSTLLIATLAFGTLFARGSVGDYDSAIAEDAAGGLQPMARLASPLVLSGSNRGGFNFGTHSGDATFEFILEGDPTINRSAYLAVGANAGSNLRFELWDNTGELGFTELGVADYAFSPGVLSPTKPAHVTYVWSAAARTMRLYLDGALAGSCSGVSPNFAMPKGQGWLGANPSGDEPMAGTIHRLTVYSGRVSEEVILSHANAFKGVTRPPVIISFTADRAHFRAGETVRLSWNAPFGTHFSISPPVGDVTARTSGGVGTVELRPLTSTTYELTVTNRFGTNTASTTVHLAQPANHPVISEFMANDLSTLADEEGRYSGWIEIHNPTAAVVNLEGYFLTDDPANPFRWAFPATNLPAGGFLVVFASGKNRAVAGLPPHANFKLDNAGEYLALVGPGAGVMHAFSPAFPPQRRDISYGLLAADPGLAQFFGIPTPGLANLSIPPDPLPVTFSRSSGTFTDPFPLALTTPDPGAEIRFTVDGSVPSPLNGTVYTSPVPVTRTTRLRAVALAGGQSSPVAGASFIKLAPDLANYTSTLPIMVIENFGAGSIPRKGWNATGAGIKQVPRQIAVWAAFERANGVAALTNAPQMFSLTGIRGRGAYSTEWRQKPYSVEAIDEQGAELEVAPLGMPPHADWVLYYPDPDPSRDPTLLFNTFAYELSRNAGRYATRFRWVEAFINENGGDLSLADRRGVYAIVEKVARGGDRLGFERLSPDGKSGGWLLNINRMDPEPDTGWPATNGATQPWFFHTGGPDGIVQTKPDTIYNPVPGGDLPQQWNAFINFDNPNGYHINSSQRAAIEDWFHEFEKVLYDDAIWRDPVNGYRKWLDAADFADYFVLNVLTRNGDGLLLSMFPWKGDDGKLRMGPAWDYNWSSYYISGGPTGSLLHRSEQLWYARLFADPDFLQLYIDRWWDLRRSALSNEAMDAIIDRQAAEITPDKALLNGMPGIVEWQTRLAQMKTWLKQRAGWIDGNYIRPPVFSQPGGEIPDGYNLGIAAGAGTIYVTTDGSDPRLPGGAVAGTARAYGGPFPLHRPTTVKARLKTGAGWSGLTSALFSTPQSLDRLVISEILYDPPEAGSWTGEEFEFLELNNRGTNTLHLGGFRFDAGIGFTFTNGVLIGPGEFLVLARNAAAFQWKYPHVAVAGLYIGRFDNGGELLRLRAPSGSTVFEFSFGDPATWPVAATGYGYSAVPVKPDSAPNSSNGAHWRPSSAVAGSPGREDPSAVVDSDGDGMLDWQEEVAGTDPLGAASRLEIDSVSPTPPGGVTLGFHARANRTYTVEYRDNLGIGSWVKLADVPAASADRSQAVEDPTARDGRFYRLLTPAKR